MKRTKIFLLVATLIGAGTIGAGAVFAHGAQGDGPDGATANSMMDTAKTMNGPGAMNGSNMMDRSQMMERAQEMMGRAMSMMGQGMGMADSIMGGRGAKLATALTVKDVSAQLEKRLQWMGNKNLKLGKVEMSKDKNIIAEIVTVDGSLVRKIEIDPTTGMRHPVN